MDDAPARTRRTPWLCACVAPSRRSSSSTPQDRDNEDEAPNGKRRILLLVLKYIKILIQYALVLFTMFIVILWIGTEVQERRAQQAPDTLYLYNTSAVCAASIVHNDSYPNGQFLDIQTFASTMDMPSNDDDDDDDNDSSSFVAHCGDCGQCSNPHDINIYDQTKNTLFKQAVDCSKVAFFRGSRGANECLDDHVGLTRGCRLCWTANIMCDIRNCLFVCFWHAMFSKTQAGDGTQELNRCTYCDEKRCGAAFVECAGANRRRSGILSDIERDAELEVCKEVRPQWWLDENIQAIWDDMEQVKEESSGATL